MTQEEKDLLLKDICARLPYKVKTQIVEKNKEYEEDFNKTFIAEIIGIISPEDEIGISYPAIITCYRDYRTQGNGIDEVKPYLRPMSSMTEEEDNEWIKVSNMKFDMEDGFVDVYDAHLSIDWLDKNHFDYRGLIEKGLALEAKEGMY